MESVRNILQFVKDLVNQNKIDRRLGIAVVTIITILTTHYVRKLYCHLYCRYYRLPNYVLRAPFFGSVFGMAANLKYYLTYTAPKYGAIATFNLFGTNAVVVNDWKLAKLLLCDNRILNRPPIIQEEFTIPNILTNSGEKWVHDRKIFVSTLKNNKQILPFKISK